MAIVFMATTADRYEWPVAIANTADELTKMLGRKGNWAACRVCRDRDSQGRKPPRRGGYHVYKIEVDDDE